MTEALQEIITPGTSIDRSINANLLRAHTVKIEEPFLPRVHWDQLKNLHILGSDQSVDAQSFKDQNAIQIGAYYDQSGSWLLVVGATVADITEYVSRCSSNLNSLSIRFTSIQSLDVQHLENLTELILDRNAALNQVFGLTYLQHLKKLNLGNSSIGYTLNLNGLVSLEEIYADHTPIDCVWIDQDNPHLRIFDAQYSRITEPDFLRHFPGLRVLNLEGTDIMQLPQLDNCSRLEEIYVSRTKLDALPQLKTLDNLHIIDLSKTNIATVRGINFPAHIHYIDLSGTLIRYVPSSIQKLKELQMLDLSDLSLAKLPDWLPDLGLNFSLGWDSGIRLRNTKIKGIDMSIFEQPREMILSWFDARKSYHQTAKDFENAIKLPQLQSRATRRSHAPFYPTTGIDFSTLYKSIMEMQDMDNRGVVVIDHPSSISTNIPKYILDQKWTYQNADGLTLQDRINMVFEPNNGRKQQVEEKSDVKATPLNEIKVVFLGDGEAGKSHTIARLLNDGGYPQNFSGVSTPGIVIKNKDYIIERRTIQVHFWDFGGQEILHSMHRMFLTKRTLYIVLVNVREGNQDERARYWLHNIRSFAKGAPVLLVLNKMDMNRNASVNENDLRAMYPQLTEVVKMSAMNDSAESLQNNLIAAMKRQIGAFEILDSPFLPAWNRLKNKLQTMVSPYIRGAQYSKLSEECGVEKNESIRKALLNWFSDLGVSFCYSGSAKLEDYVVLRPTWITNAVYIIIFNKIDEVKNGLVSHEAIFRLLHPSSDDSTHIQRASEDEVYKIEEVEYVLNVIRKFRLSFQVDENTEFMPMLCQGNSLPIAERYANDPDTLEFRIKYDYLPNNVIHRLMVERHRDLDQENVWLTGAHFIYGTTGLSAIVKSEGNLLRIIVRASKPRYTADMYLDLIKDDLLRINNAMGLSVEEMQVVYKYDGTTEFFDYEDLLLALECGDSGIRSKKQRKKIPIQRILHQTDHSIDENRAQLIQDLTRACQKMQDNMNNWDQDEDSRTMYIRDMLSVKYFVQDQRQGGKSEKGKKPGRLDLDIRRDKDVEWTILEAVIIRGHGKAQLKNWDMHLRKLLDNYNAIGRPFLFHVSYVECPKEKFNTVYTTFNEHLRIHSPNGYSLQTNATRELDLAFNGPTPNLFIKAVECVYDCGGLPMTVYQFFVRVGE